MNFDMKALARKGAERLGSILSFAKQHTKFYAEVRGDCLCDFPVINKQILIDRYADFLVREDEIPGQEGPVHIQKTSGSTGTPFETRQDTLCRVQRIELIKAANELMGFHNGNPLMHLRAVKHYWAFDGDMIWREDLNILYVDNGNLTDEKIGRIVAALATYRIRAVRGYMTTLDTMTRYMVEHGICPLRKLLFISVGELLQERLRRRIVEDLGCEIVSQYGNEECGVFGQSKINGSGNEIYLYRANCLIEILKMDSDDPVGENELGRIVVTDYTNRAMPLIRYDIGDLAMVEDRLESGEVASIRNLAGRKTDLIIRTDGTSVDLFNSISPEIYNNPAVCQWQFVQKGVKEYQLILCVRDSSLLARKAHFVELMRKIVGSDAEMDVKFVNDIPVLSSGKRKVVINEFSKALAAEQIKEKIR